MKLSTIKGVGWGGKVTNFIHWEGKKWGEKGKNKRWEEEGGGH